jgi:hypothetical protein
MSFEIGLPDMTISQRRNVLATTGIRPIEKIKARAATGIVSKIKLSEESTNFVVSC